MNFHTNKEMQALEKEKQEQIAMIKEAADERYKSLSRLMEDLSTQKKEEVQTIRDNCDAQLHELQTTLQRIQQEHKRKIEQLYEVQKQQEDLARKEGAELAQKQHQLRLESLQSELTILQEKNNALQERKQQVEATRDQDIRMAEERTRMHLQQVLDEKERSVQRSELHLHQLQTQLTKQYDEIRSLGDLLRRKNNNAKTKGGEYETIFRDKLVAAFGTGDAFRLEETSKSGIGHAGDFLMTWGNYTILWEVKNYDRPVPSSEVEKFKRDMKEHKHIKIGVMISRYTPITNKTSKGDREIEFLEGKMLLYLSNFDAMSDDMLPLLLLLFRLWWESERSEEEQESKEATIRQIERLHASAAKSKLEWRVHKTRMEETLRWMAEVVEENELRLQNALHLIHGHVTCVTIPSGIFRDAEGDERSQQWIQAILAYAEPSPNNFIILNDLADFVGTVRGFSRETTKAHIKSVLLDSVIEPQKGKQPMRVLGLKKRNTTQE